MKNKLKLVSRKVIDIIWELLAIYGCYILFIKAELINYEALKLIIQLMLAFTLLDCINHLAFKIVSWIKGVPEVDNKDN